MEFKRSSASQQGTASKQEADGQLREGLVWEDSEAGPELVARCGASGRCSSLCLWLWGQLPLLLLPLALLLLLAVQLLQLPIYILRHLHLQQVFHAMLRLIPNKHLPAGEAGEQSIWLAHHGHPHPTLPLPNSAPTWMSFSQVTLTWGSGSQLCSSRRIR